MNDRAKQALSFYDMDIKSAEPLNDDNDAYYLTDEMGVYYFLKIYGKDNDYDIIPGERIYHTYEQIQLESEILCLLSGTVIKTAEPIKNKDGSFVTTLASGSDGELVYATITSFVDGFVSKHTEAPTKEMAYLAGVSAAQLHLESQKVLLPVAMNRPHKRQDYLRRVQDRISQGIEIGSITAVQYEMIGEICGIITDCMNQLDKDLQNNVGLVHTDIINGNIVYAQNHAALIDFSRSVYSYYLYDLAEMCLHGNFGGSSPDLQREILRGYHSVKPLNQDQMFSMQVLFAMFILTIMAECIESKGNAWMESVLKWFADEVHPGLVSGKGYLDSSVYDEILIETDQNTSQKLRQIFDENHDKRILVLGTTCAGKTTLVQSFPESRDMDVICWALRPKELVDFMDKGPWTEETTEAWGKHVENMTRVVEIEPGHPLFAGAMFKGDMIVYLNVSEKTLRERTKKRGMEYESAQGYNNQIKEMLKTTELPVIVINI